MKVAINGLGRIGRAAFKILVADPVLQLVAVNDLISPANLAYLIQYDTVYGRFDKRVAAEDNSLIVDGKRVPVSNERDPARLPWKVLGVDLVFECTGAFRHREDLEKHIAAGAQSVILSAPPRDDDIGVVVHGVNHAEGRAQIISCASCTTNCITPLVEVMKRRIGIERAVMTTVHAYTGTQSLTDSGSRDFRRGRVAAVNLIPASTGAAVATTRALPEVQGRFDGVAIRAPVPVGSIADVVFVVSKRTTRDEVNRVFIEESQSERYQGVLGVSFDPIVSSDIIGDDRASVVDLEMTRVVDGTLVKVMSWYDNEWGFTQQMVREARHLVKVTAASRR